MIFIKIKTKHKKVDKSRQRCYNLHIINNSWCILTHAKFRATIRSYFRSVQRS